MHFLCGIFFRKRSQLKCQIVNQIKKAMMRNRPEDAREMNQKAANRREDARVAAVKPEVNVVAASRAANTAARWAARVTASSR